MKCPQCGGRGVIEISDNNRVDIWNFKEKAAYQEELRLPDLTGTKAQCEEAMNIRSVFVQKAKKQYQEEPYKTFIKLISYESHSIFWIANKDCNIGGLIGKVAVKNPTAFDHIDSLR